MGFNKSWLSDIVGTGTGACLMVNDEITPLEVTQTYLSEKGAHLMGQIGFLLAQFK
ncbi:hypothetical protein O185_25620 [Photorhabdus temperata J3]|uniref:Uncharacterized protein n=1 Tax=Photorhabdus temperata J3 TaxID=1389415 RepID=U7QQR5_PHOTE|nr:hypothetical protein O185_25620 [Photorhabdus temperata J3]